LPLLKRFCIAIFFLLAAQPLEAQETPAVMPIVANALATGNYKDAFTSFYQLAANDIIGPQKSLAIATNPYALIAKSDPQLLVDTNYLKYHHLRNLNFNAALVFDSAFRLNGFSIGAKYAIINARDNTISRYFLTKAIEEQGDFEKLHDALVM
jgi:hypothetical protein